METLRNGMQVLPNWTLHIDEVSNGVYQVLLTDSSGRQAGITDADLEGSVKTCERYAFDIEKQISKNWSQFLFDYFMIKIQGIATMVDGNPKNAFGAWEIQVKNKWLTYDGRDNVLIVKDSTADPYDYKAVALHDLSFDTFNEYLDYVMQGYTNKI